MEKADSGKITAYTIYGKIRTFKEDKKDEVNQGKGLGRFGRGWSSIEYLQSTA